MKRLFTILALFIIPVFYNTSQAQNCGFAQTGVKYNSSTTDPVTGNCKINVDLFFDLFTNSGSKFITVHIWPKAIYPALTYAHPPTGVELNGAITLVVDHFQDHTYAYLDNLYLPDLTVHPLYLGMTLLIGPSTFGAGYERFSISNLNLEVPGGCGIPQVFTMDVWATESASMNTIHCLNTGKDFFANNPIASGSMLCGPPRIYSVNITSIDPTPITVDYKVYVDNGDLSFNSVEDLPLIRTETGNVISSSGGYSSGTLTYLPYSNQVPEANRMLWVEVTSATLPNTVIYGIQNNCTVLPIELKLFTARKTEEVVLLNWITASESGNRGFYIERKTGSDEWQTIGFVNSLAKGGNSHSDISYTYLDPVLSNTILQYRLKQIDLDGKFGYSPIRIINYANNNVVVIFPNPSQGNVNIILPDPESLYQVSLYSAQAKVLKRWSHCNSALTITGLRPGTYLLKIENLQIKTVISRKIVIQ